MRIPVGFFSALMICDPLPTPRCSFSHPRDSPQADWGYVTHLPKETIEERDGIPVDPALFIHQYGLYLFSKSLSPLSLIPFSLFSFRIHSPLHSLSRHSLCFTFHHFAHFHYLLSSARSLPSPSLLSILDSLPILHSLVVQSVLRDRKRSKWTTR